MSYFGSAILLIGLTTLLLSLSALVRVYATRERKRMRSFRRWNHEFQINAARLVSDASTPPSVVEAVGKMNNLMGKRHVAMVLYLALIADDEEATAPSKIVSDLKDCPIGSREPLMVLTAATLSTGLLAMSYSSGWGWGVRARAVLAERMAEKSVSPRLVNSVQENLTKTSWFYDAWQKWQHRIPAPA